MNTYKNLHLDDFEYSGISVVVPVFNSENSIADLISRLLPVLEQNAEKYELIFVNDCSADNSWREIVNFTRKYTWIKGINLSRNYGQHNALLCGIRNARFEIVVTMDDDLQNPPEEIPNLLQKMKTGYDVVYGTPEKEQHGLLRDLASKVTKITLQGAMGAQTASKVSAFRIFRTDLRNAFASFEAPFVSIDVLLTWGTTSFASLPVKHDPRQKGQSNYTLRKLITHAINMMTGFSTLPLELASLIGFAFTLFGMAVLVFVVGRYLIVGGSVPGFPFLASIIALFSGVQLFALGIIGEYLSRMHFRMMDRPTYTIRETTEKE